MNSCCSAHSEPPSFLCEFTGNDGFSKEEPAVASAANTTKEAIMTALAALPLSMHPHADLMVFTSDDKPLVVVEIKGGKDTSTPALEHARQQLQLLSTQRPAPYLLAVFRSGLFLWLKKDEHPREPLRASIKPLLMEYAGSVPDRENSLRAEGLQILVHTWLDDLALGLRQPKADSEADQLLVSSGIYEKMQRGRVTAELAP
jgi:hypothetical protein